MAMWEKARARAEEVGSMVLLLCDGGAQGVSGVAGHGIAAYENPSSLELGLDHALSASDGHSISVVHLYM